MTADEKSEGRGKDPEKGFVVVDRRSSAGAEDQAERAEPGDKSPGSAGPKSAGPELPRIDFSTFALSLSTSALFHMGLVEDPETGEPSERNLPLARQTIDTLELLEEKTRGNLTEDEARLLESLLYELRMRFVESTRRAGH